MRYKLLGKSGLRVSELCLGTMTFGEDWGWGSPREASRLIFEAFAHAGGNFLDTANAYTNGTSEKMLGEFVASQRRRFVLATKYTANLDANDPNAGGNHRKNMVQSIEASLKRLGTDYIDLYWVHAWDELTPLEETMRGLDDLVRQGKVLYVGLSDFPAWMVARAGAIAELRGWAPCTSIQIEYSLLERTPERELVPMAQALGLTIAAWAPLGGGLLTGKYNQASAAEERRMDKTEYIPVNERNLAIAREVQAVAREIGRSPAQVALAWLTAQPNVIPIVGARRLPQWLDNLGCLDITLSADHLRRLDEVSAVDLGFPMEFLRRPKIRKFVHGQTWGRVGPAAPAPIQAAAPEEVPEEALAGHR